VKDFWKFISFVMCRILKRIKFRKFYRKMCWTGDHGTNSIWLLTIKPLSITRAIISVTTLTKSADDCENWPCDTKHILIDILLIRIMDVTSIFPPYSPFSDNVCFLSSLVLTCSCSLFWLGCYGTIRRKLSQSRRTHFLISVSKHTEVTLIFQNIPSLRNK
jgi:hypothetical protein